MSTLIVEVDEIREVLTHPNADSLEIVVIRGWNCIVKKGLYKTGETVVFIPPDAILPDSLIEQLGVRNYLAGKDKNRIKCAKLRGEMSYGLIMPNFQNLPVGTDMKEILGIKKYEPPMRTSCGDAAPDDPFFFKFTDIENINNYPHIFKEGEIVIVSEKVDGSNDRIGFTKNYDDTIEWKAGSRDLKRIRPSDENLTKSTYWYPFSLEPVRNLMEFLVKEGYKSATLFGEVFGRVRGGLKSMHYGIPNRIDYVAFSLQVEDRYVDWDVFESFCIKFGVPVVPVIERCPFNMEYVRKLAKGNSVMAQKYDYSHVREGIVVCSSKERMEVGCSRAILKILNPDYLELKHKQEEKGEEADFKDV